MTFKNITPVLLEPPSLALFALCICPGRCFVQQHDLEVKSVESEALKQSRVANKHLKVSFWNGSQHYSSSSACQWTWRQIWQNQKLTPPSFKACLSLSASSQTSPIPTWDLHATIKLSICRTNRERGTQRCCSKPAHCALHASIWNNPAGSDEAVTPLRSFTDAMTNTSLRLGSTEGSRSAKSNGGHRICWLCARHLHLTSHTHLHHRICICSGRRGNEETDSRHQRLTMKLRH